MQMEWPWWLPLSFESMPEVLLVRWDSKLYAISFEGWEHHVNKIYKLHQLDKSERMVFSCFVTTVFGQVGEKIMISQFTLFYAEPP